MGETIKTLIVEDDHLNVALLTALLKKYCPEIEVIAVAKNADKFIDLYFDKRPSLILLDIHLGEEKDSLEILSDLNEINAEIIIISADESHAVRAINQYRVAGYVTKPIGVFQLKRVIATAVRNIRLKKAAINSIAWLSEKLIAISTSKSIEFLMIRDILYLEADGKYTNFHQLNGEIKTVSKNIGEYEKMLPTQVFFRIHHKFIVNLQKVQNINKSEGNYYHLINGISLSIAKRRHESLRKFLNI
jgi:two-component system LytT family response regulator